MAHFELLKLLYLKTEYKPKFIFSGTDTSENILQDTYIRYSSFSLERLKHTPDLITCGENRNKNQAVYAKWLSISLAKVVSNSKRQDVCDFIIQF